MYRTKHVRRVLLTIPAWICWASCATPPAPAAESEPLSTPELLVHLARDEALNRRGRQTAADVLRVKALLHAATRLNPRLGEAYAWLYELAALGGDEDEAAEALERLVAADPNHAGGFALWVESGLQRIQTAEGRRAWLETLLAQPRSDELQSLLHTRMARLAFMRLERGRAETHLALARQLYPFNRDLPALELELVPADAPPHVRLKAALDVLATNPARVELCWRIGLLLDECGFAEQAATFYEHALAIHALVAPQTPIPAEKLLQLARNALARAEVASAIAYASDAVRSGSRIAESAMFLHWLWSRNDRRTDAGTLRETLAKRFARIEQPADWPVDELAQAAWFYCVLEPRPQRALRLAEAAAERAPGDVFATRVLGWAQALNGRTEQARQTLMPIAAQDPYAAYRLAKLLRDAGDTQAPERLMAELEFVPRCGPAFELLSELAPPGPATRPVAECFPQVADLLARFDRDLFELHKDPSRFLAAQVTLEDVQPGPGEPWWAVFTLSNQARFPITLGPEWMVNPVFLLSFATEGDRKREFPHLMTISLDRARVIPPGRTVRLRRTIDVGPLRRMSRQTPQQLQRITVRAILDAERDAAGRWRPALAGQQLRPVYFSRRPANTDREALHALFRALSGESDSARFRAIEVLAELLGEQQRAALKPLAYRPAPVPVRRIQQALLSALGSQSWEVRVRTLDALQVAGLDARMVAAAEACLAHPHWLVRLMAVRLLARQGESFAPTAERMAADDADELVRDLAASYCQRWSTSQPATQPGSQSGARGGAPAR